MHPEILQFNFFGLLTKPITIHTYGAFIGFGFLCAMLLAKRQAQREGENPEHFIDIAFFLLFWGLIGSRLLFMLTQFHEYIENPIQIVMFWRGGLVFYGGFITATLYLTWNCHRHKRNFFKVADIFIPYLALAHAFGRLGCLSAGCCFGKATHQAWGIIFPAESMVHSAQVESGLILFNSPSLPVHPTQLYEAGIELLFFILLVFLRNNKRFHGQIFLLWLILYPIARSFIEMFRGDKIRGVYILSTSQYISIGVAITAIVLYLGLRQKKFQTSPMQPLQHSHPS